MMDLGLMKLLFHFRQRWRFRHMKTWSQMRQGRVMQAISYYILGTDRRRFEMLGIRDVRNYPSYHFILWGRLIICPTNSGHHSNSRGVPAQIVTVHGVSE